MTWRVEFEMRGTSTRWIWRWQKRIPSKLVAILALLNGRLAEIGIFPCKSATQHTESECASASRVFCRFGPLRPSAATWGVCLSGVLPPARRHA